LEKQYIKISMTQSGDPLENSLAERVNGILKDELLEKQYRNFKEAQQAIATAISVYNHIRPHSSIDMLTPVEAHLREGELKRRWKNYYSKRKEVAMT
jgi:transposase InsO family protein